MSIAPIRRGIGFTELGTGALSVLTNSAVAFTSKDCWIFQLVFNNKSNGAVTVTVTDQNTTPLDLITAQSIAANTTLIVSFPDGQFMAGGFKWNASANTSINASVSGVSVSK